MFSIITSMHTALTDILKVEHILFPLIQEAQTFLDAPDIKQDSRLKFVCKLIYKLLDESQVGCKHLINVVSQHIVVFNKKPDRIILELKQESFALVNEDTVESDLDDEQ